MSFDHNTPRVSFLALIEREFISLTFKHPINTDTTLTGSDVIKNEFQGEFRKNNIRLVCNGF